MQSPAVTTRFGLMRHAETEWNRQKRIQGHSDSPLTEEGKASADRWGKQLKTLSIDRILSSDLGRVLETAQTINRHLKRPIIKESRLREQHWGRWEGMSISEIENSDVFIKIRLSGWDFRPIGGESRLEVWQRSSEALLEAGDKWPGNTLLVVAHEGVIRCIINRLCGRQFLAEEAPLIKSAHLHWLACGDGELETEVINALKL